MNATLSYDEKIMQVYGLTPAEVAEHHAEMAGIAREEREAKARMHALEAKAERRHASAFPDPDEWDDDWASCDAW